MLFRSVADMERQAPEIMKNRDATLKRIEDLRAQQQGLVGDFGILQAIAPTRDEEARAKRASEIQGQIQQLQKMLEDAEAATKRTDLRAGKEETDRIFGHAKCRKQPWEIRAGLLFDSQFDSDNSGHNQMWGGSPDPRRAPWLGCRTGGSDAGEAFPRLTPWAF